ncbi:MAG: STAS domain-containing protein [Candidatus Berkiella sp.]
MQTFPILYLNKKDFFVLKLIGELRFNIAPTLESVLKLCNPYEAKKDILIDMTQTSMVDSTVLGTLLNFFLAEEHRHLFTQDPPTIVCNNDDIKRILRDIGFNQLFKMTDFDERLAEIWDEYTMVEESAVEKGVIEECIRHSHLTLSQLHRPRSDMDLVVRTLKDK